MRVRLLAASLFVLGLVVAPLLTEVRSRSPAGDFPVRMSVPSVDRFRILADAAVAGEDSAITYRVWLNLSGGGSVQYAWMNVSLDPDLTVERSITPSGCTLSGNESWQCNGLREGAYLWTVETRLASNTSLNRWLNATASVRTYTNRQYSPSVEDQASVWISGVVLSLEITAVPDTWVRPGELVEFRIRVFGRDQDVDTAHNVVVHLEVSPGLRPNVPIDLAWEELSAGGVLGYTFPLFVEDNATVGDPVWVTAILRYEDSAGFPFGPIEATASLLVQPGGLVSAADALAGILVGALAILAWIGILIALGQQRIRIDEVLLVHASGALIQHATRTPAIKKDDDLMAAMLVAIQAFVQDSWKKEATLDEFAFGRRKAAFVRGKHVVLAAILSRGDPAYLVPQLRAAIEDLERVHGGVLADWDGRLSRLPRAERILSTLLRGGYRKEAWTKWFDDAKRLIRHRG